MGWRHFQQIQRAAPGTARKYAERPLKHGTADLPTKPAISWDDPKATFVPSGARSLDRCILLTTYWGYGDRDLPTRRHAQASRPVSQRGRRMPSASTTKAEPRSG